MLNNINNNHIITHFRHFNEITFIKNTIIIYNESINNL